MQIQNRSDTIFAPATASGIGAIAVIRVSGIKTFEIVDTVFSSKGKKKKNLRNLPSHTIHYGWIRDGEQMIDEVLVSIFKGPNSYTGEDVIEISCHGSVFIQRQIMQLLI